MNISHKVLRKYIYFQEMLHIVPSIEFRFSYPHTGMGAQILAPKKGNMPLFTVTFSIAGYASSF